MLLPAGITSEASIKYKNESELLTEINDVDKMYIEHVLPQKMKHNLNSIMHYSLFYEFITMLKTLLTVLKKKNI